MIFLFAHSAGASSRSDWMWGWTDRLSHLGTVRPFDYPYMAAGRKAPDRLPKLLAAHRAELDSELEPRFRERTVEAWTSRLGELGIAGGAMASVPDALKRAHPCAHPHPGGQGEVFSLPPGFRLSEAAWTAARPPPALGADRDEVLRDWLD